MRGNFRFPTHKEGNMTQNKKLTAGVIAALAAFIFWRPAISQPPKPVKVTVPQNTAMTVRLNQAVGSKVSASGQKFSGKLAQPVVIEGKTVVPAGTEFAGTVMQAVPAGRLAGGATLRIALSSFNLEGTEYRVQTAPVVRVSQGKGKRTAEFAGGGAALGAAIGAIAGGGKGALIGAAAGAGGGAAGSAFTGTARDIVMPAESLVTFKLKEALIVTVGPVAQKRHS
jgi:hypothetical protein